MANPEQDEIPLERLVVFDYENNDRIQDTHWPGVWLQRMYDRFRLRRGEASRNVNLQRVMIELLEVSAEVLS